MTTLVAAIGFRNVLAHEYGHVNADQVYDTLQTGFTVYDTCDLLLAVTGEASHVRTAPLGWDMCWLTTRRHDEPMAGPHRRYSYPRQGDSEVSFTETPQRVERVS